MIDFTIADKMAKLCIMERSNWAYMEFNKFVEATGEKLMWAESKENYAHRLNEKLLDIHNTLMPKIRISLLYVPDGDNMYWSIMRPNGHYYF